jgi:hypothetical protein
LNGILNITTDKAVGFEWDFTYTSKKGIRIWSGYVHITPDNPVMLITEEGCIDRKFEFEVAKLFL